MAATSSELTMIIRARNRASADLKAVSRDLSKMNAQVKLGEKSMAAFKKVGKAAMIGVGAAATAFVVKAGADFLAFDDKMTQSLAIMGDEAQAWRGQMESAAREVAKTTTFSASQAAEAYFFLASAGMDAEQSIAAMPQVAKFAQAGMFDLATATDLATDAQSALGLSSDDTAQNLENLTRVTDVLVKANTLANATVEQFSTSLTNKAGAAIKVVGKDIEEGVAVLAAFADQGVKGAEAGTALNIVFRELQTKAIKNKDTFAEMGVAVFDSTGEMRNMADIVADLEGLLEGMSDEQKKATLATLGFSDKSVIFIQTLLGTSEAIRGYEKDLRNAGGTTERVAEKQLTSVKNQFALLMSQVQDVGISLGQDFMPSMLSLAKGALPVAVEWLNAFRVGLGKVIDFFGDLPKPVQAVIKIMGGLGIALAALYGSPVMAGLAAVAAAIALIGRDSAKAETSVKAMQQDLADISVIRMDTLADAFGEDVVSSLLDAGVTLQDFTNLLTGDLTGSAAAAARKMQDVINHTRDLDVEWEDLRGTALDLNVEFHEQEALLDQATKAEQKAVLMARDHKLANEESLRAANDLDDVYVDLTDTVDEVAESHQEAEVDVRGLAGALLEMADPVFGAISSLDNLDEVLKRIDEDGQRTEEEMLELAIATLEAQAAFDQINPENIEAAIGSLALGLGISRAEAEELLRKLGVLDGMDIHAEAHLNIYTHTNIDDPIVHQIVTENGAVIEFMAKGGPVAAGQPYIIGEEGPEMFVPDQAGTILPAGSFDPSMNNGSAIGGGGSTYNIHLHDVDLTEGSRKTLNRIREGLRQLDKETA